MATVPSLVLYEHASGYGLFRVKEFEEVAALEAEVEAAANDVSAFNSVVRYGCKLGAVGVYGNIIIMKLIDAQTK